MAFEPRRKRQLETAKNRLCNKVCIWKSDEHCKYGQSWSHLSKVVANNFPSDTIGSKEPQLSPSMRGHIGRHGPIMS